MTWTKLDDGFWRNPKITALSHGAFRLYVLALNWSCDQLTDGIIPESSLPEIMPRSTARTRTKYAQELVDRRLWQRRTDDYATPDFLTFQRSKNDVLTERQRRADQAKAYRDRLKHETSPVTNPSRNPPRDLTRDPNVTRHVTAPRPDPTSKKTPPPPPYNTPDHDDDDGDHHQPTQDEIDYWTEQWATIRQIKPTPAITKTWQPAIAQHITQHGPPNHQTLHNAHQNGIRHPAGWEHHIHQQPPTTTTTQPPTNHTHLWADHHDGTQTCARCHTQRQVPDGNGLEAVDLMEGDG